jgi:hypothetical protein
MDLRLELLEMKKNKGNDGIQEKIVGDPQFLAWANRIIAQVGTKT